MRIVVSVLAFLVVAAPPMSGQAAGAALAALIRPDNRRPLFGSDGANLAVAAGFRARGRADRDQR